MLSVVIIASNESDRIQTCIESVKFADEIIVVDSNSKDQTVSIAKKCGAKVVEYKPETADEAEEFYFKKAVDFSKLRNKGLEEAKGEWILYVDADERVLQSLKEEIEGIINSQNIKVAWAISRRNIILGEEKKYKAFWPDYVIRLFKKEYLRGWEGKVHEQPKFKGELGYLKESLLHLTHRDIDSMVIKSLDWSNIDAKLRLDSNHPKMNGARFFRILMTEIWNQGIARRGFFNGTVGVIDSLLQVFSLYISYVKLWELQQPKPLSRVYQDIDKKLIEDNFKYEKIT